MLYENIIVLLSFLCLLALLICNLIQGVPETAARSLAAASWRKLAAQFLRSLAAASWRDFAARILRQLAGRFFLLQIIDCLMASRGELAQIRRTIFALTCRAASWRDFAARILRQLAAQFF